MTALVEDDKKKQGLKIMYACVETAEVDVSPANTRPKRGEDSVFGELVVRRDELKIRSWTRAIKV